MSFENKVVLITGAGSGIGEATAVHFARHGAKLSLVDIHQENLEKVKNYCKKCNSKKVLTIVADVSKDDDNVRIVNNTLDTYERIDVVVTCAGISGPEGILDSNFLEAYDRVMSVNLRSAVALTHYVAPALIESRGCIIFISSSIVNVVTKGWIPYSQSKSGIDHFTKQVALELASKGVRVNSIVPSAVKTNFLLNNGADEGTCEKYWKIFTDAVPLKRLLSPDEVAEIVAFTASDKARGITGTNIVIDNGFSLSSASENLADYPK